jgi:tRNA(fMet)-specific endonuclease VapC
MSFLLDTDTCSAHMRRPAGLTHRFIQHSGRLAIPSVVLAELYAGAYLLAEPERMLRRVAEFLPAVEIVDFDAACAEQFGKLRGVLKRKGASVSPIDLMIAAVALAHDLTVVTHNTADFAAIPDLRLADWLTP